MRDRDLRATAVPAPDGDPRSEPWPSLELLFARVEQRALEAMDWYLEDKRVKKRASRYLRSLTIVLASAGGVVPLLPPPTPLDPRWGFVLIGVAVSFQAFDRFFGLSSAWMRDIAGAQAIHGLLDTLQQYWIAYRSGVLTEAPLDVVERLRTFSEDLARIIESETSQWRTQFNASLAQLAALLQDPSSRSPGVQQTSSP